MDQRKKAAEGRRPDRRAIWLVAGVLIVLLVIIAAQGLLRGSGEAVGITKAAPGDDNANPAGESRDAPK